MCKPKKFDLVHQTISPRERVGSGDETREDLRAGWNQGGHRGNGLIAIVDAN